MSDYTNAPYWAITGIGYGKGFTAEEAVENYMETQRRNFPHLTDDDLDEAWGRVWKAPEGTVGFVSDGKIRWYDDDDNYTPAEDDQMVGDVGRVPDWAK